MHLDAQTVWTIFTWTGILLALTNGALSYWNEELRLTRITHGLLDAIAPAVRANSTGVVGTIFDQLTREGQGTWKIPILQRSAPPGYFTRRLDVRRLAREASARDEVAARRTAKAETPSRGGSGGEAA